MFEIEHDRRTFYVLKSIQRLIKISDDIVDMLRADREADGAGRDVLLRQFLVVQLTMRGRRWMNDEALDVRNIRQQGEDLEIIAELLRRLAAALDLDGKDRCAAVREIALIKRMIRMIRNARMIDLGNHRMI